MASPYRVTEGPPPPPATVFRGLDDARSPLALWLLLAAPLVPVAGRVGIPPILAAVVVLFAALALHRADRRTRRFELRVGPDGFRLRRYRFGLVPTAASRVSLEWEPVFNDEWDDFEPAGLSFAPPRRLVAARHARWRSPPVFGPVRDAPQVRVLVDAIRRAAVAARAQVSGADAGRERRRRSGDAHRVWDRVDPASVLRGPWGRVRSVRLRRGATLDGLRLPAWTTLEFEFADDWQSPSTPDRVTAVTLGGPVVCGALSATLCRGARLALDERRRLASVEHGFSGPALVAGVLVDGRARLSFDARGRLTGGSLGAPLAWGRLRLPAGTRFSRGEWGITFEGPGIEVEGVPEARPTSAQATLTPRGARASLARLLVTPEGRVGPQIRLCEHPTGTLAGPRHHRMVKL